MQADAKLDDLRDLFNSFDIDKSGTIELSEIKQIAEKLGEKIPEEQLQKIMKTLDINNDGMISFDEFQRWWVSGRKGKLQNLIFLQAKALKMVNFAKKFLADSNVNIGHAAVPKEYDEHTINVQFGQKKGQQLGVEIEAYLQGQKYQQKIKQFKNEFEGFNQQSINIVCGLPCQDPSHTKQQIEKILQQINQIFNAIGMSLETFINIKINVHEKQKKLLLNITLTENVEALVTQIIKPLQNVTAILGKDFYVKFITLLKWNTSINQIIQQGNIMKILLNGFQFLLNIQTNTQIMQKIRKIFEDKLQWELIPMTLLRNTKINIKLKSPEDLGSFLDKLGIREQIDSLPLAKDIISQGTSYGESLKQNASKPTSFALKLLSFLQKYVQQYIEISLSSNIFVIGCKVNAKNASKIYKILLNQE